MVDDIIAMYESAIVEMKSILTNNLLKYDVHTMTLATIFMGHVSKFITKLIIIFYMFLK